MIKKKDEKKKNKRYWFFRGRKDEHQWLKNSYALPGEEASTALHRLIAEKRGEHNAARSN